ncbi:hypothetical protein QTP88_020759 [Uroleucon formosanum]
MLKKNDVNQQDGRPTKGIRMKEHKYSVIPAEWLVSMVVNSVSSSFYKWPSHRVMTMMLMKGGQTSEKWMSYPVKIIERFDSYETAAAKEIEIFMPESENDKQILRRGKRLKFYNIYLGCNSSQDCVPTVVYNKATLVSEISNSTMSCTEYKTLSGAVESSLNYILRPSLV